ncbi:MAG: AMP-binding protein [Alcanivoracaceae bacterium]|nr:AMP-binding protein [Alcanivoracaceae bacterium]
MQLLDRIRHHAHHQPDRIALSDESASLSYAQLVQAIEKRADQLKHADAKSVALTGDNSVSWALWDLACLRAGVINTPLPGFFSQTQTENVIRQAGIDAFIDADGDSLSAGNSCEGKAAHAAPAGTAKITFTSGSTADPKGVCLSKANLDSTVASLASSVGTTGITEHLCVLPLATLLENVAGVYLPLWLGAHTRFCARDQLGFNGTRLDIFRLIKTLSDVAPQSVILVPELLSALVKAADLGLPLPDSLAFVAVGGGCVSPAVIERAWQHGLPVHQGYGLSEATSVVALTPPGEGRADYAGKLLEHITARIDEDDHLLIQGDSIMLGYLGEPEPASRWLDTGDLGQLDADGYLKILGRSKNLLITSWGRNISPEWVESELLSEPVILQAMVLGEAELGLRAVIYAMPGISSEQISAAVARCNARLPEYARIIDTIRSQQPFATDNGLLTGNGRLRRAAIEAYFQDINPETFPKKPQTQCDTVSRKENRQ